MWTARTLSILATAALPFVAACGDEPRVEIDDPAPGCSPFATSAWAEGDDALSESAACLLPFPSRFATRADPESPTGARVDLRASSLPHRDGKKALIVTPYDAADGFSPVTPILLHFGADVDLSGLSTTSEPDLGASIADEAPVAIFDVETGDRVPYVVEMDARRRADVPGHQAFILRPMAPMAMGHRHAVAIRAGLRDTSGRAFESPPAFAALRDRRPTTSAVVEAARDAEDEVFDFLDVHGYRRADLLLAWDFPVASEAWVLGPLLSMRREALDLAGDQGLSYAISKIQTSPTPDVSRIVEGTFQVPSYLRDDDTLAYDGEHRPVRQAHDRSYPFTLVIPRGAETATEPMPLAVLGHDFFDDGRALVETGPVAPAIQALANGYGVVVIASDWIGLTSHDLPRIVKEVGGDLDRIGVVTGQLQQSIVSHLVLTRLARGALADDPAVRVGEGPLVDRARTLVWGAGLGGALGASFTALSPDVARAALAAPGGAWSTMLTRSIALSPLMDRIEEGYPDPLDVQILVALLQARFDHADPANLGALLLARPLPDAPSGRVVLLQEATGDAVVPNVATEILARSVGVAQLSPGGAAVWGLDQASPPTQRSALAQYEIEGWGSPEPPAANLPAKTDNGVHAGLNLLPNAHLQIAKLWLDGTVDQLCKGPCNPD